MIVPICLWIVSSSKQEIVIGVIGRNDSHTARHVEGETGHVLAHALIQRRNLIDRIALGQISP